MKKHLPLLLLAALFLPACKESRHIPDPRSAANDFLQKIGESRFQDAYESTAFAFRAQTNFRSFQATAKDLGLSTGTVSCRWLSDERREREAKLSGELTSAQGKSVPVRLTLILERNAWRVFALRTPTSNGNREADPFSLLGKGDSFESSANHEVPSLKVLQNLTATHLLLLNEATQKNDFREFYNKVSLAWQSQLTLKQLTDAFRPYVERKPDISSIAHLEPVFDVPAEIDSEGFLTLRGHYETQPYRTSFALRFIFEFPYWKLHGIQVQIQG